MSACSDARFSRVFDPLGYVRFRDWRIYGEEGLGKREAAIWLHEKTLTLEHAGQALSRYDVEYAPGDPGEAGKKLAASRRPRLFETSFALAQLRLFGLDCLGESGWLKAMRLEDYAPRRPHPERCRTCCFPTWLLSREAPLRSPGRSRLPPRRLRYRLRRRAWSAVFGVIA